MHCHFLVSVAFPILGQVTFWRLWGQLSSQAEARSRFRNIWRQKLCLEIQNSDTSRHAFVCLTSVAPSSPVQNSENRRMKSTWKQGGLCPGQSSLLAFRARIGCPIQGFIRKRKDILCEIMTQFTGLSLSYDWFWSSRIFRHPFHYKSSEKKPVMYHCPCPTGKSAYPSQ